LLYAYSLSKHTHGAIFVRSDPISLSPVSLPRKTGGLGANLSAPVKASLSGDVHPRGAVFLQPESRRMISPIAGAQNLPVSVPTGVLSDEKNYDPDCA
jgi:hypothetical protein